MESTNLDFLETKANIKIEINISYSHRKKTFLYDHLIKKKQARRRKES